jgi:radical SAM/Cys-rich protein
MNRFDQAVCQVQGEMLCAEEITAIQANLGLRCNLQCRHCHVEASPQRTELMSWVVMMAILRLANELPRCLVDVTGGAPELHPAFRRFIAVLRQADIAVQVRTNLVVFTEPDQADTPEFLAGHQVHLVASLPCYLDENVTAQRGQEAFPRSIKALRHLNALGYGRRVELPLDLVYNPGGPFLPPAQAVLEADYRRSLRFHHGVEFTRLLTITNMPMGSFLQDLQSRGKVAGYQALLQDGFNPQTLAGLMCRHQVCVAWDGRLADCDFNLTLGLGLATGLPQQVGELQAAMLRGRRIVTGEHCFACTAGHGSSCGGALVA